MAAIYRLKKEEADKRVLGLNALIWVFYLERLLIVEELSHAFGVEIDSGNLELDLENAL